MLKMANKALLSLYYYFSLSETLHESGLSLTGGLNCFTIPSQPASLLPLTSPLMPLRSC